MEIDDLKQKLVDIIANYRIQVRTNFRHLIFYEWP